MPIQGGDYVVVHSLFGVAPIVCVMCRCCVGIIFVMQFYCISSFEITLLRKTELIAVRSRCCVAVSV